MNRCRAETAGKGEAPGGAPGAGPVPRPSSAGAAPSRRGVAGRRPRTGPLALALALGAAVGAAPVLAAAPAPETSSFVVIGHPRGDGTGELWPWLDVLLAEVRRVAPERVFLTGDLVWGGYHESPVDVAAVERDWERLDAALATLGVPVHRVPGNHDVNDAATRALFEGRYGALPAAVRHGPDLFLLLDSTRIEEEGPPSVPRPFTRPGALSGAQREGLRRMLAGAEPYRHAFVLLHHVLWWDADAPWWREVHPLLRASGVRAVFAGDMGPLKLSHVARDGIDYWQSALEGDTGAGVLRALDGARAMHLQPDTFLEVQVDEGGAEVRVHPVAIEASAKLSPAHFRTIHEPLPRTLGERVEEALGGPLRRSLLALAALGCLALGALLGGAWTRRRGATGR